LLLWLLFPIQSLLFLDFQFLTLSFSSPPIFSTRFPTIRPSADTESIKVEAVVASAFAENIG
jgi:hypothetical protein